MLVPAPPDLNAFAPALERCPPPSAATLVALSPPDKGRLDLSLCAGRVSARTHFSPSWRPLQRYRHDCPLRTCAGLCLLPSQPCGPLPSPLRRQCSTKSLKSASLSPSPSSPAEKGPRAPRSGPRPAHGALEARAPLTGPGAALGERGEGRGGGGGTHRTEQFCPSSLPSPGPRLLRPWRGGGWGMGVFQRALPI